MKNRNLRNDIKQAEDSGNALCNNRRNCGSPRAHPESYDKHKIQDNVQKCAYNKKYKRKLTVSKRPEDTGQKIIKHLCQDSAADDHYVRICVRKNIRWRIHKDQKRFHKCHKQYRQKCSDYKRKNPCSRYCLSHALHITGSEFLRREDSKTSRHSHDKTIDQKHDRSRAADRRQSLVSDKLTNDHSICHIVKLLKYITDKNRQGKAQNNLHRISDSHIILC